MKDTNFKTNYDSIIESIKLEIYVTHIIKLQVKYVNMLYWIV